MNFKNTADAIRFDPAALAAATSDPPDWATVRARLEAKERRVEDHTLRTTRWVMQNLREPIPGQPGLTTADVILQTLQSGPTPRVRAAYDAMSGDGIDLADEQVQTMIDTLGASAGWDQSLIDIVKAAGVRMESIADQFRINDTTESAIAADWNQAALYHWWVAQKAVIDEQISSGVITNASQAASAISAAALEA